MVVVQKLEDTQFTKYGL